MSVLITNQGVYLINDKEQSWQQNPSPEDREELSIPESSLIERFNFREEIKRVHIANSPN